MPISLLSQWSESILTFLSLLLSSTLVLSPHSYEVHYSTFPSVSFLILASSPIQLHVLSVRSYFRNCLGQPAYCI